MRELRGSAAAPVSASDSGCFALLVDIERYPEWHPDVVRRATVTRRDADGRPARASTTVHLGIGPLRQDFSLDIEVATIPNRQVRLSRVPHDSRDPEQLMLAWQIEPGPTTRLAIELRATLDMPGFLPVRGIGDSVAQGFVAAARAELERRGG